MVDSRQHSTYVASVAQAFIIVKRRFLKNISTIHFRETENGLEPLFEYQQAITRLKGSIEENSDRSQNQLLMKTLNHVQPAFILQQSITKLQHQLRQIWQKHMLNQVIAGLPKPIQQPSRNDVNWLTHDNAFAVISFIGGRKHHQFFAAMFRDRSQTCVSYPRV